MGVYGRRESGKTYFVTQLLMNQERLITNPFTKVIWIYKTFQNEVYQKLSSINQLKVEFLDDLPNFDAMGIQSTSTCIVIDDLQSETFEYICDISITKFISSRKVFKRYFIKLRLYDFTC